MKKSAVSSTENMLESKKRDTSKIYFFIFAIVALLATNIYFYVKFQSSGEKINVLTVEKENIQTEIDRIEAELDRVNAQNLQLTDALKESESQARDIINNLRDKLEAQNLSESELLNAQKEIKKLKAEVAMYLYQIDDLKASNQLLETKNADLTSQVSGANSKVSDLQKSNETLKKQISSASALKLSNITVNGVNENRKGNLQVESRAKRVDKLEILFTVVENNLAKKGEHPIYFRIINPQGNLIVNDNNIFYVHGEKLQYTFKEEINFTNNGEEYKLFWSDDSGFEKGAYTILLYSDSAIMGRSTIILK